MSSPSPPAEDLKSLLGQYFDSGFIDKSMTVTNLPKSELLSQVQAFHGHALFLNIENIENVTVCGKSCRRQPKRGSFRRVGELFQKFSALKPRKSLRAKKGDNSSTVIASEPYIRIPDGGVEKVDDLPKLDHDLIHEMASPLGTDFSRVDHQENQLPKASTFYTGNKCEHYPDTLGNAGGEETYLQSLQDYPDLAGDHQIRNDSYKMQCDVSPADHGPRSVSCSRYSSQDSAISVMTPPLSSTMSGGPSKQSSGAELEGPYTPPSLHLQIPLAPQEPLLDRGLSMSPDAAAEYDNVSGLTAMERVIPDKFPRGANDRRYELPDINSACNSKTTSSIGTDSVVSMSDSAFILRQIDACKSYMAIQAGTCPSDTIKHLLYAFNLISGWWYGYLDGERSATAKTVLSGDDVFERTLAALSALKKVSMVHGSQDESGKTRIPTASEVFSLILMSITLLGLAVVSEEELARVLATLQHQARCYAKFLSCDDMNTYSAAVERLRLLCNIDEFNPGTASDDIGTKALGPLDPQFNLITEPAAIFVDFMELSYAQHLDGIQADGHAGLPPYIDYDDEEKLIGPLKLNLPRSDDKSRLRNHEALVQEVDQQLQADGLTPTHHIRLGYRHSLQKRAAIVRNEQAHWLWQTLSNAFMKCAERVVASPQGCEALAQANNIPSGVAARTLSPPAYVTKEKYSYEQMMDDCKAGQWKINTNTIRSKSGSKPTAGRISKPNRQMKPKMKGLASLGEGVIYCPDPDCGKSFKMPWGRRNLKKHLKGTQAHGTPPLICPVQNCSKRAGRRSDHLKKHMRERHPEVEYTSKNGVYLLTPPSRMSPDETDICEDSFVSKV